MDQKEDKGPDKVTSRAKVAREVAESEFEKWLDFKKVKDTKRESNSKNIETLVESIMDGTLVLNHDNHEFKHNLSFPIKNSEGQVTVTELIYKPRLIMREVNKHLKGVKSDDADGRVVAYICALTGKAKGIITELDTEDNSTAQGLAVFFL